MSQNRIEVAAVINETSISAFQILIFSLCFVIMMLDGFDTQAIAYVAPSLAAEWKLPPGTFGPVFSAALLGAMIGAFSLGYLADRIGRKRTLIFCLLLFGALNIASAYAPTIQSFTILRFLCGIGLGGAIPNVMALVSEYAPAKRRATLVALTWCGFALGAVFGGLISIPLIANFGWPSVFITGGVLPILLVPAVAFALPESIKHLILSSQGGPAVASILRKIDARGQYRDDDAYVLNETRPGRGRVLALFRDGLAPGSIFLCAALFMSLLLVYCFISWIPLLLRQAGLPLQDALMGTIIFNLAGIPGSFLCTWLIDRPGSRPLSILIGAYFLGAIAVVAIGFTGTSFWPLMTTIFASGFLIIGAQLSLNAVITNYYPTAIRGTGVGWSQVFGRTGSLVGPLVGGILVSGGMLPGQLFQISGVAPLLACLFLIIFVKLTSGVSTPAVMDGAVPVGENSKA
jgi:AAHS family 4-hydroxybenzoate transporter-like MFS transporter